MSENNELPVSRSEYNEKVSQIVTLTEDNLNLTTQVSKLNKELSAIKGQLAEITEKRDELLIGLDSTQKTHAYDLQTWEAERRSFQESAKLDQAQIQSLRNQLDAANQIHGNLLNQLKDAGEALGVNRLTDLLMLHFQVELRKSQLEGRSVCDVAADILKGMAEFRDAAMRSFEQGATTVEIRKAEEPST